VNQVTPGGTKTPIWSEQAPTDAAMAGLEKTLAGMVALGRMVTPRKIAKAALYLASTRLRMSQALRSSSMAAATGAPIGAPVYRWQRANDGDNWESVRQNFRRYPELRQSVKKSSPNGSPKTL